MSNFIKKASIVLIGIVSMPVIAFLAYLAWLDWQESEVVVISLKCQSNESDKSKYYRITKRRKSDTPEYFSTLNSRSEDDKPLSDDLFLTAFELKKITSTYVEFQISDAVLFEFNTERSKVADTIIRIDRETLSLTWFEDGKEKEENNNECEEISDREIMKVAQENFAAATKDRKF